MTCWNRKNNKNFDIKSECTTCWRCRNQFFHYLSGKRRNLYPVTQHDLMNSLIEAVNTEKSQYCAYYPQSIYLDCLTITLCSEIGNKKIKYQNHSSKILAFWHRCWFGKWKITSILDEKEKQIRAEKIDDLSHQLNKEFDKLVNLRYEVWWGV